jgi:hypothetical protein
MISDKGACNLDDMSVADCICCAENCKSGVVINPRENPGDAIGDIPMEPIDIIPFRDNTPGDEKPPRKGFCMLSEGRAAAVGPVLLFVLLIEGFYSGKVCRPGERGLINGGTKHTTT